MLDSKLQQQLVFAGDTYNSNTRGKSSRTIRIVKETYLCCDIVKQ